MVRQQLGLRWPPDRRAHRVCAADRRVLQVRIATGITGKAASGLATRRTAPPGAVAGEFRPGYHCRMDYSRQAVARRAQARQRALEHELERVTRLLRARPQVRLVLVFGSMAAGTTGPHSDLDLVVVLDTELPFRERIQLVFEWIQPEVATDLLVYTPAEWAQLRETRAFVRRLAAEGRVIYEAAA